MKFDFLDFFSPLRVNGTIGNHAAKKDSFAWEAKAKTRLDAQKGQSANIMWQIKTQEGGGLTKGMWTVLLG